jgi:hypothetical protein
LKGLDKDCLFHLEIHGIPRFDVFIVFIFLSIERDHNISKGY